MEKNKTKSRVVGVDIGTAFFQVAEMSSDNNIVYKTIRNAFVELPETDDTQEILKNNGWRWIKDGDHYYVIGEDSLKVSKLFPNIELRRPMQDGILNKSEEKKMIILSELIEKSIGKAPDDKSIVCTCVSSQCVDTSGDSTFHKVRVQGMFKRLGWNVKVIEEGQAVVLSERPTVVEEDGTESPYSGIGISFGGGRSNCVLSYKGLQVLGLSVQRSGDWIDKKVSEATDTPLAKVISIKEKFFTFEPELETDEKKLEEMERYEEVLSALDAYYTNTIEYVFTHFSKKFQEVKSQFDVPLDIVIAGGTSMPKGFCKKVESVVRRMNLPFKIKEVKHSSDPRNSVVKGLLTQAILVSKKMQKAATDEELKNVLGE